MKKFITENRMLVFRIAAVAVLLLIAALMFVIGRSHTILLDNKDITAGGKEYQALYSVEVKVKKTEPFELMKRERGEANIMGQTFRLHLEVTEKRGQMPYEKTIKIKVPYFWDYVLINLPMLLSGEDVKESMSAFHIEESVAEEAEEKEAIDMGIF